MLLSYTEFDKDDHRQLERMNNRLYLSKIFWILAKTIEYYKILIISKPMKSLRSEKKSIVIQK